MDRIILIGIDQGVMIGGRFDGWLAHLTHAGWVTVRKLNEADPYTALPEVLQKSPCTELGALGLATGVSLGQSAHDAEKRRRDFLSSFPVLNAQELHENMLAASPEAPPLSAAVPASGGVEAVARERADIARLADELALNARLERAGEKATSVGSTGAICMSIGAESMAKTIARSIRERASLSPAPMSGSEAGGEAKGWAAVYDGQIKSCHRDRETCVADAEHYQAIHPVYLGPAWRHQED